MPAEQSKRCRVSVLAFSDANCDGRTLNICRTLAVAADVTLWNLGPNQQGYSWRWQTLCIRSASRMLWRWLWFVAVLVRHCWRERADVVWAADVYCLLPAVVLGLRWRAHLVYDSREIYSSLGTLSGRKGAQWLLALYERVLVRWVDRVVVSGQRDAHVIEQRLPLRQSPVVVLNVPFYAEPQRSNRLRQQCGIAEHTPILLYQGAVLGGRGLRRAIEVLDSLSSVHLCVLGDGEALPELAAYARERSVADRVHLLGTVPYAELLDWTASADIGWCWIEPISQSYALALPNKLFEYAMARIPVIASALPAISEVLTQFPFGISLPTDASATDIATAIETILTNASDYQRWADRAAREFCYERQQQVILSILPERCRQ